MIFLNISNYLSHLELKICCFQIVIIMIFIFILNVGIKRIDCTMKSYQNICIILAAALF